MCSGLFWKYDIWFTGYIFYLSAVAENVCMQEPPDIHLRFGVLAFNPAHIVAAGGFIVYIGHGGKVQSNALRGF